MTFPCPFCGRHAALGMTLVPRRVTHAEPVCNGFAEAPDAFTVFEEAKKIDETAPRKEPT